AQFSTPPSYFATMPRLRPRLPLRHSPIPHGSTELAEVSALRIPHLKGFPPTPSTAKPPAVRKQCGRAQALDPVFVTSLLRCSIPILMHDNPTTTSPKHKTVRRRLLKFLLPVRKDSMP